MGEVEGRDGCRMTRMGFKRFRCLIHSGSNSGLRVNWEAIGKHELGIPVDLSYLDAIWAYIWEV